LDESFTRDPREVLRRLQSESPVSPAVMWGGVPVWLVTRYLEAKALLNDSRISKNREHAASLLPPNHSGVIDSELHSNMLNTDPPTHPTRRARSACPYGRTTREASRR
jgi:cytochrome P450